MNNRELQEAVKSFERTGRNSDDLNIVRKKIFDAYAEGKIKESAKNKLLKDLYFTASLKNIFFVRLMERTTGDLPKDEAEELARQEAEEEQSYEESYEESYSYEEDDEEK